MKLRSVLATALISTAVSVPALSGPATSAAPVTHVTHASVNTLSWGWEPKDLSADRAKRASKITEVRNNLPAAWPVGSALKAIDKYTGTKFKLVKLCSGKSRCITIQPATTSTAYPDRLGVTYDSKSYMPTIVVYIQATKDKGWYNKSWFKKNLLVHELGHADGLPHVDFFNIMYHNVTFAGDVPPIKFTAAQKKILKQH